MIYLASPYSHPDPLVVKTRYLLVMQTCAALINAGRFVWSPIVHCHEMTQLHNMPSDAEFWKHYNFDFMRRADEIMVLKIPGWDQSKGVKMEIDFAQYNNIPLYYVNEEGKYIGPDN